MWNQQIYNPWNLDFSDVVSIKSNLTKKSKKRSSVAKNKPKSKFDPMVKRHTLVIEQGNFLTNELSNSSKFSLQN